ncbi:MAG: sigma 54-interacting transcriptional regulator [Sedimentibacter sp.]|uniref:sigma-54 interaction domain-containing protein n=1 Tax=Sedimentibacter sp. TaxID=1960295 RepID=UPI0031592CC6
MWIKEIKDKAHKIFDEYQKNNNVLDEKNFKELLEYIDSYSETNIDFKEIVDNIDESVFITDKDGFVLYVNQAYSQNTGVLPSDVMHRYVPDIIAEGIFTGGSTMAVIETQKKCFRLSTTYRTDPPRMGYTIGVPLFDSKGELKQVVVSSRPILTLTALKDDYTRFLTEAKNYTSDSIKISDFSSTPNRLIGSSPELKAIWNLVKRVAPTEASILITGESGVGKEVVADEIFRMSSRNDKPFIKVNCAAIPANLLESELFGYDRGAFSGANTQGKKGLFEMANNGTLLLDEVGEMQLDLQAKILRAIQNKEVQRIGGTKPIPLNIRFIAATNCNLKQKVAEGKFRQDLYFRLHVIPIDIPPLRKRPADISALCDFYISYFNEKYHKEMSLSDSQKRLLEKYNWPGNVRELENILEYLTICSSGVEELDECMLRELLCDNISDNSMPTETNLGRSISNLEKELIEDALAKSNNLRQAGKLLNISASTLSRKIKQYDIDYPRKNSLSKHDLETI